MRSIVFVVLLITVFLSDLKSQNRAVFLDESSVWADSVLEVLSEEERIAQLFMVAAYSNKGKTHQDEIIRLVERYKIGGVMFLQGGPLRQAKFTNNIQQHSKVPLMIAIDAEWGVSMRLDSSLRFPWQMTLGAIEDTHLIYQMGVEVARQCKLLGVHINFAPVIDVNSNPKNPIINNRSFGEDPFRVAKMGNAYMRGMQDYNVLACAKHFPGHGDTDTDSHKTLPFINHKRDRLEKVELFPFEKLINKGLGSIMVAHLNIPALDEEKNLSTSLSKKVVAGLLKDDLGFTGLAITDALNMKGVSESYEPGILDLKALLAGNDILLFSEDVPKAIQVIKQAIQENKISQNEIDLRCHKILMAKKWMGLDSYKPVDLNLVANKIVTKETRIIDKKLISASLTLLKNKNETLPLKELNNSRIASVNIGENTSGFQQMLSNYTQISFFNTSEKPTIIERALLLNKLSKYDVVIVSVHKSNANAWKPYKISKSTDLLLQAISTRHKTILTIFANPYSLNSLNSVGNFDAVLLSYQNSEVSQKKTAQAIFGGIPISGKVPVSTKHFKINTGLETQKTRLGYVSLEEAPCNSNMLYEIDSIISNAISEEAIPGCQVLISKNGDVFFNKSYGHHTYEKKNKVKNTDLYDIASVTKIACAAPILMQMVDDGSLILDDKLGKYLDLDSTNKDPLIIRDILAHQSGLNSWIPFYKQTLDTDSVSGLVSLRDTLYSKQYEDDFSVKVAEGIYLDSSYPDSIFQQILSSDLSDKKEYKYSDLGYYLFKELIEDSYDSSLDSIVYKIFLDKLGMFDTRYNPLNSFSKDRVVPTEEDSAFRGQLLEGYVHDMGAAMQGGVGAHAGLFSNANDLAKLMQMYLQNGSYGGEYYLSEETIQEFTRCQFPENNNRRGAAFDKPALENQEGGPASENASMKGFGHSGFTGTLVWVDPEKEIIYVFLSNRIHPDSKNNKLLEMNIRTDIMEVIFNSIYE